MPRLIIGGDNISFAFDNKSYQALISRLIFEETVIFKIDYSCESNNERGRYELLYSRDPVSGQLLWIDKNGLLPGELIKIIAKEIEKQPHLLSK
jgi:hypothetical protein